MASPEPLKLAFVTLDVFTDTPYLGNPLAVVFIPASKRSLISQETKQRIAREFNLSETVFLHTLENEPNTSVASREIDIFMTDKELPFAGHPTIGSANLVLRHLGWAHVDTLVTKAGPIPINPLDNGGVQATIPHAVHIHRNTLAAVTDSAPARVKTMVDECLDKDPETRAAELGAPVVDIVKGMTFVLARLPSLDHLARLSVKHIEYDQLPDLLDEGRSFVARYHYVVTEQTTAEDGSQHWAIQTRNVELGFEDPATGSAACTLASYLSISNMAIHGAKFSITQGVEMGRRSNIEIRTVAEEDGGKVMIKDLYMGGKAVVVMEGKILV